jgi:hypothetical protein
MSTWHRVAFGLMLAAAVLAESRIAALLFCLSIALLLPEEK